jgi:hypothetical protein
MKIQDISIGLAGVLCGVVVLGTAGCGGGKDVQVKNQGRLCIFPASNPGTGPFPADTTTRQYVGGEALTLSVLFPFCLSGSCMTNRMSSCMAQQTGNTFVVTATASYHETGADACTDDCGVLNPQCMTPVVSEGTFTFQYAGGSVDLVVPSTAPAPCVGMAFGS